MPRPTSYAVFCLKKKSAADGLLRSIDRLQRVVHHGPDESPLPFGVVFRGAPCGLGRTRGGGDDVAEEHLLSFFAEYGDRHDLHSFPTRRSSDLAFIKR